nr:FtsW/RodA/SpoVE family cell cycle protein [Rothia mucilaginosa]
MRTTDPLVRLATGGIMIWLTSQAIINMGMVSRILPVIGVPLPFVSYGGSSLLSSLFAAGLLLAFARQTPLRGATEPSNIETQSVREVRRANADWQRRTPLQIVLNQEEAAREAAGGHLLKEHNPLKVVFGPESTLRRWLGFAPDQQRELARMAREQQKEQERQAREQERQAREQVRRKEEQARQEAAQAREEARRAREEARLAREEAARVKAEQKAEAQKQKASQKPAPTKAAPKKAPAQPRTGQQTRPAQKATAAKPAGQKPAAPKQAVQQRAAQPRTAQKPRSEASATASSLSPVAHSTVRRARYLRVCSRCILRTVSVVPSDRVILDRALNVRQRRDRALRQRVLRPRVLRRTALSSVRLRARLGTRLSAAPVSRAKPSGTHPV